MRARAYVEMLTPQQLAALDAKAAQVDLPSIGYTLSGEDARNVARWERRKPREWSSIVAWALREVWVEQGRGLFPYWPCVVARAIELRMEGA